MDYNKILERSLALSKPYWDLYDQLIRSKLTNSPQDTCESQFGHNSADSEDEELNPEYLELLRITREHQAKREKLRKLRQKQGLDVETYYRDISQVDTLVEENLVEVPDRTKSYVNPKQKEQKLIELYGGPAAYESVRSIEMAMDDYFAKKRQELRPAYWPVIPINYKRYLNSIER